MKSDSFPNQLAYALVIWDNETNLNQIWWLQGMRGDSIVRWWSRLTSSMHFGFGMGMDNMRSVLNENPICCIVHYTQTSYVLIKSTVPRSLSNEVCHSIRSVLDKETEAELLRRQRLNAWRRLERKETWLWKFFKFSITDTFLCTVLTHDNCIKQLASSAS